MSEETEHVQLKGMVQFFAEHQRVEEDLKDIAEWKEKIDYIRQCYLFICFHHESCVTSLMPLIQKAMLNSKDDLDESMVVDYTHMCPECERPTLYSSKDMVTHDYGPWCLEPDCLSLQYKSLTQ